VDDGTPGVDGGTPGVDVETDRITGVAAEDETEDVEGQQATLEQDMKDKYGPRNNRYNIISDGNETIPTYF
jgi:hypothetical protein